MSLDKQELEKQSSMDHWYPRVKNLSIKTPDTYRIEFESDEEDLIDFNTEAISKAVRRLDGPPAFIRTDMASSKHKMGSISKLSTDNEEIIENKVKKLVEGNMMKGVPFQSLYIREWIDIAHDFKAFDQLPIGYEVRYFVHDGKILGKHFYWPEDAMRFWSDTEEPDNWKEKLKKSKKNTLRLTNTLENKLNPVLQEFDEGFWSIDFAFTDEGDWQLIDIARGEISWHPKKDEVDGHIVTAEKYKDLY